MPAYAIVVREENRAVFARWVLYPAQQAAGAMRWDGEDRKHPHRLDPDEYRRPGQPVLFTVCAREGDALAQPERVGCLVQGMEHIGRRRSVRVHAYCIMPDHLHVVASVVAEGGDLAAWVRYVKRDVARAVGVPGLWQRSYWDRHTRVEDDLIGMVEYILANPVRAGLCEVWTEWPYLWSQWHDGGRGSAIRG